MGEPAVSHAPLRLRPVPQTSSASPPSRLGTELLSSDHGSGSTAEAASADTPGFDPPSPAREGGLGGPPSLLQESATGADGM
jgi:hypothetical protein